MRDLIKEVEITLSAKSFEELLKLAESGNSIAMSQVASTYEYGFKEWKIKKNLKEAFKWYKKGADSGLKFCKKQTAEMYAEGIGVKKDKQKALLYWDADKEWEELHNAVYGIND